LRLPAGAPHEPIAIGGMIEAERWRLKDPRRLTRFQVSVKFFLSGSSGWKKEQGDGK
jgi:hypothetical protein